MNNKGIKKKLSIIMSALIIILVIGSASAYFLAKITGEGKSLQANSGDLSLTYTDGKEINADKLIPGWTDTKEVVVENTGDGEVTYSLYWSCVINELTKTNDLTYKITDEEGSTVKEGAFPTETEEKTIISNLKIEKDEIKKYNITVSYAKTEEDQSVDMGKIFKGIVNVLPLGSEMNDECTTGVYTVNLTTSDVTIENPSVTVNEGEDAVFTFTENTLTRSITNEKANPKITCTNNQSGRVDGNNIIIEKVTNNTECTFTSKFNVNVIVENGEVEGKDTQTKESGSTATFKLKPNEGYKEIDSVTCTNEQTGSVESNTLTIENITKDTTCTIEYTPITYTVTYDYNGGVEVANQLATDTIIDKYSTTNSEGLIKVDQPRTKQMIGTTEYRYSGSNDSVKNYVNFNNETWRIIGVFDVDDGSGNYEKRIKIIRDESIGEYSWDSSASDINSGYGINQWGESVDADGNAYSGADLKTLLNTTYYNRTTSDTCYNGQNNVYTSCNFSTNGLSDTARSMIDDAKWYTAGVNLVTTTPTAYIEERGSELPSTGEEYSSSSYNDTITRKGNWIGKIALIYPSDYGYASSSCYNSTTTLLNYEECTDSNWLYTGNTYKFLSPRVSRPDFVFGVFEDGHVVNHYAYDTFVVRPVVYLKSTVKITGGTGENAENAYQLSLTDETKESTTQTLTYNSKEPLQENNSEKFGYEFVGWSKEQNATEPEFVDKAVTPNFTSEEGDNVTLYAVWKKKSKKVSIVVNGGTLKEDATTTLKYNESKNFTTIQSTTPIDRYEIESINCTNGITANFTTGENGTNAREDQITLTNKTNNTSDSVCTVNYSNTWEGLESDTYEEGSVVSYAGKSWTVVNDNGNNVSLALNEITTTSGTYANANEYLTNGYLNSVDGLEHDKYYGGLVEQSSGVYATSNSDTSANLTTTNPYWVSSGKVLIPETVYAYTPTTAKFTYGYYTSNSVAPSTSLYTSYSTGTTYTSGSKIDVGNTSSSIVYPKNNLTSSTTTAKYSTNYSVFIPNKQSATPSAAKCIVDRFTKNIQTGATITAQSALKTTKTWKFIICGGSNAGGTVQLVGSSSTRYKRTLPGGSATTQTYASSKPTKGLAFGASATSTTSGTANSNLVRTYNFSTSSNCTTKTTYTSSDVTKYIYYRPYIIVREY